MKAQNRKERKERNEQNHQISRIQVSLRANFHLK